MNVVLLAVVILAGILGFNTPFFASLGQKNPLEMVIGMAVIYIVWYLVAVAVLLIEERVSKSDVSLRHHAAQGNAMGLASIFIGGVCTAVFAGASILGPFLASR